MRLNEPRFAVRLDHARAWERALAAWIRSRGWYVVPAYDFSGKGDDKAPKLLAPPGEQSLVLPDLQCFRDGAHQWLECKWKTAASVYRKGGYATTGIELRLHEHYLRVEKLTGARVVIAFLHENEREIRGASLAELRSCFSHRHPGGSGMPPMMFWRYDAIPRWAGLDVLVPEALPTGATA